MNLPILHQVRLAVRPGHRLAFAVGAMLGGSIPVASYWIAHQEAATRPWLWFIVASGCLFSALTVFQWSRQAFHSTPKAIGFVVLVEGTMLASGTTWLTLAMLVSLILINAMACACALILEGEESPFPTLEGPMPVADELTKNSELVDEKNPNALATTPVSADKRLLIERLSLTHPTASNREIARLAGVHHSTVGVYRKGPLQ